MKTGLSSAPVAADTSAFVCAGTDFEVLYHAFTVLERSVDLPWHTPLPVSYATKISPPSHSNLRPYGTSFSSNLTLWSVKKPRTSFGFISVVTSRASQILLAQASGGS